ncbi:hypothetical protein ANN_02108 [Periplaneta americana]|uniref:Tc1-like transposase DDE domain-containing protein n=1 Tax=Periplaneta americana TaxID=6978 RepID=A0ABQ8TYU2_PERAM|nr:hypothetical protein ANN_02108 [Periplaneta americana]
MELVGSLAEKKLRNERCTGRNGEREKISGQKKITGAAERTEGTLFIQQDNHPIHTANRIQRWFARRRDVDSVNWPPNSPDMNPIQNLWAAVKRILSCKPLLRTPEELWDRVLDAWEEMAKNSHLFHNLVDSMPRRMRAVVDAGGFNTGLRIQLQLLKGHTNPPKRNTILGLVNKLETTGSLVSEKGKHRSSRLPTVVVVDVRASFFDDRIISRNLWPPRSPDLTTPDFFLWGYLKDRVYATRPQTLDDLKHNITQEIQAIDNRVLQRVASNMERRVELCLMQDGGHFQHLL